MPQGGNSFRKWTASVWMEIAQPYPLSVLFPATVTTKTSLQADSKLFVHKTWESFFAFAATVQQSLAGPLPGMGQDHLTIALDQEGPLVPWSSSY